MSCKITDLSTRALLLSHHNACMCKSLHIIFIDFLRKVHMKIACCENVCFLIQLLGCGCFLSVLGYTLIHLSEISQPAKPRCSV